MMKTVLLTTAFLMGSVTAFAAPARHSGGGNEITAALGMDAGAVNIGAEYEMKNDIGWGGYFLMQTEKEKGGQKIVNQVMSFGGQGKIHVYENSLVDAYMAPGIGLHMIKDVQDRTTGDKSDVTTFGPTLRLGVLFSLTPDLKLGLTRQELWNWFDDKAAINYAYYQAALAFSF